MSPAVRILMGLGAGLAAGTALAASGLAATGGVVATAEIVGGLWLDALRMTIVPLVFALLVTGVASATSAATAGGVAGRSIALFALLLAAAAAVGAMLTPALLALLPIPAEAAEALRIGAAASATEIPPAPPIGEWLRGVIPVNAVAAAAEGAMLPLVVFALIFGFAMTRIGEARRERITELFRGLADTMLVIVGWVLWIAPIGVFALALAMSARTGLGAVGALGHYLLIVCGVGLSATLLAYPLAVLGGRTPVGRFARAAAPAQAVAVSTQSSLASLPAMIKGARAGLALPTAVTGVTLPLAVSLFRVTNPLMNVAVALYVASVYGVAPGAAMIAAGAAVAVATSLGAVGVSSQVNFFVTIPPICMAMGVPFELLALLIAVETIPDLFRTVGNVTMDMAATTVVARGDGDVGALRPSTSLGTNG